MGSTTGRVSVKETLLAFAFIRREKKKGIRE